MWSWGMSWKFNYMARKDNMEEIDIRRRDEASGGINIINNAPIYLMLEPRMVQDRHYMVMEVENIDQGINMVIDNAYNYFKDIET